MKKTLYILFCLLAVVGLGKTANQVYRLPSSGPLIATYGAVNLASSAAVTSILSVANGGTGLSTSPITVPLGGTGATTLTGAVVGNGASAFTAGTLQFANGGTGITACGNQSVPYSNGASFACDSLLKNAGGTFYINGTGSGSLDPSSACLNDDRTICVRNTTGPTLFPLIVSPKPSTHGLMIVRGGGTTNSTTITGGEGYSYASAGAGNQIVTFTTAFADTPICTCNATGNGAIVCAVIGSNTTFEALTFTSSTGAAVGATYNFMCIGQRGG